MGEIERRYRQADVTILNGAAISGVIDVRPFAGGVLSMPASWTAASIGFQHSTAIDGTFQPLYDDTGEALVEVAAAASRDIVLPDALFACFFIKLWSETAGSGIAQGGDRDITISLKG